MRDDFPPLIVSVQIHNRGARVKLVLTDAKDKDCSLALPCVTSDTVGVHVLYQPIRNPSEGGVQIERSRVISTNVLTLWVKAEGIVGRFSYNASGISVRAAVEKEKAFGRIGRFGDVFEKGV